MNFRWSRAVLRAWLDREPMPHAEHCPRSWGNLKDECECDGRGRWRSFPAECACVPAPVADGTFGWVMRLGECHANASQASTVAPGRTNGDKLDP